MKRCAALAVACLLAGLPTATGATEAPADRGLAHSIAVSYHSVPLSSRNLQENRVGRLVYRGGLELSSSDPRFGGWSGLLVSADGTRLLSQSDEAHWLRADLAYDSRGRLAGVSHAELADMEDLNGTIMHAKEGDAEGLAALSPRGPDGPVAVSFEGNHRIWSYDLSGGLDAAARPIAAPPEIKNLRPNLGLEGLTALGDGRLLAVAETAQDANGNMPAWIIPADGGSMPEVLAVKPHPPYDISDAAMSPDGTTLYLLERHYFDPLRGIVIAVREIDASAIRPGAVLDGSEIAQFTLRENIDNMEGIALRRGAGGETLVYLISDDNYSAIERTLLLMFEIAD